MKRKYTLTACILQMSCLKEIPCWCGPCTGRPANDFVCYAQRPCTCPACLDPKVPSAVPCSGCGSALTHAWSLAPSVLCPGVFCATCALVALETRSEKCPLFAYRRFDLCLAVAPRSPTHAAAEEVLRERFAKRSNDP